MSGSSRYAGRVRSRLGTETLLGARREREPGDERTPTSNSRRDGGRLLSDAASHCSSSSFSLAPLLAGAVHRPTRSAVLVARARRPPRQQSPRAGDGGDRSDRARPSSSAVRAAAGGCSRSRCPGAPQRPATGGRPSARERAGPAPAHGRSASTRTRRRRSRGRRCYARRLRGWRSTRPRVARGSP